MSSWNGMPPEIKYMIVDRMDLCTRTNLKKCSKSSKNLVDSVPLYIEELDLRDEYDTHGEDIISRSLEIDYLNVKTDGWHLNLKKFGDRKWNEPKRVKLSDNVKKYNSLYLIMKSFIGLLSVKNVRIERLGICYLKYDSEFDNTTIRAESVLIVCKEFEGMLKFIKLLSSDVKYIAAYDHLNDIENYINPSTESIGVIPAIVNAKELDLQMRNNITDEELLSFKCTELNLEFSHITSNGIKQLIRKIINQDYPKKSSFHIQGLYTSAMFLEVVEGLDYTIIKDDSKSKKAKIIFGVGKSLLVSFIAHYDDGNRFFIYVE